MKFTFLACVKNEEQYIEQQIYSLLKTQKEGLQIIIVDDHSTDRTHEIVEFIASTNSCIQLYKNEGFGKVDALNTGYKYVKGNILKLVDGDDYVVPELVDEIKLALEEHHICIHDFDLLYPDKTRRKYEIGKIFFELPLSDALIQMKSLPKASWAFTKEVYQKIFPIPSDLPYEDIWISMRLKTIMDNYRYFYIQSALYIYRQHCKQTFGGVLDYSKGRVVWRAKRNCVAVSSLIVNPLFMEYSSELKNAEKLQNFIAKQSIFPPHAILKVPIRIALRFILLRYFLFLFPLFAKRKFKISKVK